MKRMLKFSFVITLLLTPTMCFCWWDTKHPISELLIHRVYLDTNFVFCGSDAHWGTNVFGLFVFDRRTETWTNYPSVMHLGEHCSQVKNMEEEQGSVYVTFFGGYTLRFNRQNGSYDTAGVRQDSRRLRKELQDTVDGIHFRVNRDSIIMGSTPYTAASTGSSELIPTPTGVKPVPKVLNPTFSHPVVYQNKIYMPYDLGLGVTTTWTNGIAVFDVAEKAFNFYASDILKGTVTGGFVYDSLIIFATAGFWYEGNAGPAAGFVAFNPADSTFSLWKEFPLPDKPRAIFQVAQDKKEYWMGTDKGVFRIDKKTHKTTHYQITRGIVSKDNTNTHYGYANYQRNSSPVVAELDKGDEVELVGVLYGWCEIKPPTDIVGWVEAKHVEQVILREDADKSAIKLRPMKMGQGIPVRISDAPDAEVLLTFDVYSVLKGHQYEVVSKSAEGDEVICYKIRLPTAWININDLIFHLGEVE